MNELESKINNLTITIIIKGQSLINQQTVTIILDYIENQQLQYIVDHRAILYITSYIRKCSMIIASNQSNSNFCKRN